MDSKTRNAILEPILQGKLSSLIPDLTIISAKGQELTVPALLTSDGSNFSFTVHFLSDRPPDSVRFIEGGTMLTEKDQITLRGQIDAEFSFECRDVFPAEGATTRSRGTSTMRFESTKMHLVAEKIDKLENSEVQKLLGMPEKANPRKNTFNAHLIFHGPKLKMRNGGSKVIRKNDFLGEAADGSFDTHVFSGLGYEGAIIQRERELHLHLRSIESTNDQIEDPAALVDSVVNALAFVHGFHPWPLYHELRIDHRVIERWISPQLNLKQTYLAPVSESLWAHLRDKPNDPFHKILPTVAKGMEGLPTKERERLYNLLWHFRCAEFGELPSSTSMLILCAVLEGFTKMVAGVENKRNNPTAQELWKAAINKLGLSWETWGKDIFDRWKSHRDQLAHGWLWVSEDKEVEGFYIDHPILGCAFSLLVAVYCGYEGHVMTNPFKNSARSISDFKEPRNKS